MIQGRLPTDAELDRAARAFAAAQAPPRLVAPRPSAPFPAAASERRPPDFSPPRLPGTKHQRYQRRRFALRAHGKLVEETYGALRASPELLGAEGSPEFRAGAWLLLIARGLRPKTAAVIAEVEDAERDAMLTRLEANGFRRGRSWGFRQWADAETGNIEFVMTVLTTLGVVVRIPAAEEGPVPPAAPPAPAATPSHARKPASACLVCRRVGGACRRHGGPSRSTAFRGAGSPCSWCRRPAGRGHAAGCRARTART